MNNNYCQAHQSLDYVTGAGWQHECTNCPSNWATYCLFSGRHEMPENSGELFSGFDFDTMSGVKTDNYETAMASGCFNLYVTGLTPAALQVVMEAKEKGVTIRLLHYNRDTGGYVAQWCF